MLFGKVIVRFEGLGECKLVANLRGKQWFLNSASIGVALKGFDEYLYMF